MTLSIGIVCYSGLLVFALGFNYVVNVFAFTLGGLSDPGYSLWSSLFQRCISLITIGLLKSTNWKPVTFAPPCINLSREISLKPCQGREEITVRANEADSLKRWRWKTGDELNECEAE